MRNYILLAVIFCMPSWSVAFNHPGIFTSLEDLKFLKEKVEAKQQPWYNSYLHMVTYNNKNNGQAYSSLSYKPSPKSVISSCNCNFKHGWYGRDATATYANALMWFMLQDSDSILAESHAQKAIAILDEYARTIQRIDIVRTGCGHSYDHYLRLGMSSAVFVAAAEIIQYTYAAKPGKSWPGFQAYQTLMRNIIWGGTWFETDCKSDCRTGCSHNYEGTYMNPWSNDKDRASNWETGFAVSRLAISVLLNDEERYNESLAFLKYVIERNVRTEKGENVETERDCNHPAFGFGQLIMAAEIAYQQGDRSIYEILPTDVCVPSNPPSCTGYRLANGAEYTAAISFQTMPLEHDGCPNTPGARSCTGNKAQPFFWVARNHYQNRMQINELYWINRAILQKPLDENVNKIYCYPFADFTHHYLMHAPETGESNTPDPEKFSLWQNYPNPFNPSTRIQYDISQEGHVTITIYDVLGHEVKTLVNKTHNTGTYTVTWDGKNSAGNPVPNNIYFYKMKVRSSAGDIGTFFNKMILL